MGGDSDKNTNNTQQEEEVKIDKSLLKKDYPQENPNLSNKNKKKLLSIAVFGAAQVGKSSIIKRYIENIFEENITPGPLQGILKKEIHYQNNNYILRIIDTNSLNEEKFTESFLLDKVDAVILIYNVCERNTFDLLFECFKTIFPCLYENNVAVLMLANKVDNNENYISNPTDKIQNYIKENDMLFFECSAKTGNNVNKAINALIEKMNKNS